MAEKSLYNKLADEVGAQETVTDLFKLANSDGFKAQATQLSPDDLKALRQLYRERMKDLDGKVRLQDFVGQTLNLTDVEFWHSDTWNNDGVTLRFHLDDSSRAYKALTSSASVVRFASGLDPLPSKDNPVRVLLDARPVSDEKRAAQGQKVFRIKRLAAPTRATGEDGAPF